MSLYVASSGVGLFGMARVGSAFMSLLSYTE